MVCLRNALRKLDLDIVIVDDESWRLIWAVDLPECLPELLWRLHRNEPGWLVGEQRHVRVEEDGDFADDMDEF
ncbi:unnamed protein product [Camellia sinensis]